jgi:DNA polymerase III subunit beta
MKLIVHKERLQRALSFVDRVTSRNATLPILSNILLKTEHGRLNISATNLELGVSSLVGAKIDSDGQIAVPGKVLYDFIRNAPDENIAFDLKQNTLHVHAGSYKTTILCFDAAEYPIIPKIEGGTTHVVSTELFGRLISTTLDSIALSDSRPELSGALLKFEPNSIVMAATDIFRLAEEKVLGNQKESNVVIIPRGTLAELSRILGSVSGDITIRINDNQISFSHDEFDVVSRLIDGRYPDYQKVIPERSTTRVLVQRSELENAAKVAALFSSSISDIKVECDGKGISMSAKNSSKGEAQAGITANIKGDPFEVSMNYHYFLDGLKIIPTEKVILEYTGKGSPFVMRPDAGERNIVYLIMPLRS